MTALPLNPPPTSAELDHAAEIWTAAQDNMVARGYARKLWGCQPAAGHEFVVLMIGAAWLSRGVRRRKKLGSWMAGAGLLGADHENTK